jgi:hypothetical protein
LRQRGLPHEPVIFFGKSDPEQWQVSEPEDFKAMYCIENYLLTKKGYEMGSLEHLAASILKTINRLENDKEGGTISCLQAGILAFLVQGSRQAG